MIAFGHLPPQTKTIEHVGLRVRRNISWIRMFCADHKIDRLRPTTRGPADPQKETVVHRAPCGGLGLDFVMAKIH